ncbi:hypothetical protein HK097_005068, partial [Rhizophlyctis rosea]
QLAVPILLLSTTSPSTAMQFDVCEPKPDGSCEVLQNGATVVQGTYLLWRTYMIVYGAKNDPFSLETSWTLLDGPIPTPNSTWRGYARPDDCYSLSASPCEFRHYLDVEKTYISFNKTHPVGHMDPFPIIGVTTMNPLYNESAPFFSPIWTSEMTGHTLDGLIQTPSGPKNVSKDDPRLDYHVGQLLGMKSNQNYKLEWGMYWLPQANYMTPRGASGYLYVVPNVNKTEVPTPPYVPQFPAVNYRDYRASSAAKLGTGILW